jgi:3-hydroxyacyl-CoA dehydrogenase
MSNRIIKKIAVLGSGVMGSRIALHFAGVGLQVLLLDMIPSDIDENATTIQKNKIVNDALQAALKSNPSPSFHKDVVKKIRTGNFTDNMKDISDADWIIEVVIERLDIKKQIFETVEKFRKPGTLVTTNTSGIPIHLMTEGRSDDFKKHFCGTHFFNPPRYLRLLEIIPTEHTDSSVIEFLLHYGDVILGKTTVLCKDTPAFIANRIGVYSMMSIIHIMEKQNLSIDEIEALTGPIFGRPKSATFRTADVVGIDTLVKVANGVFDNCLNDESRDQFKIPDWLNKVVENKWLGDKSGNGFFKKTKAANGEKNIEVLDLNTLQYQPRQKVKFASIDAVKQIEDVPTRIKSLFNASDKAGQFYKSFHYSLFSYEHEILLSNLGFNIYEISE